MKNRRKNHRVDVSFPVECKTLPSRNYIYTVSKDLSVGGTKILTSDHLKKNATLRLNINLIDSVVNLKAKVSWCTKESASQRYSSGLEFVEITQPNLKELSDFLGKIKHS